MNRTGNDFRQVHSAANSFPLVYDSFLLRMLLFKSSCLVKLSKSLLNGYLFTPSLKNRRRDLSSQWRTGFSFFFLFGLTKVKKQLAIQWSIPDCRLSLFFPRFQCNFLSYVFMCLLYQVEVLMTPPRIEHVRALQIRVTFGENFQVALRRLLEVLQK